MSIDTRTKLDIIYLDALGDIHEVIDLTEALKKDIPLAADQACQKIHMISDTLLQASRNLAGEQLRLLDCVEKSFMKTTEAATESAKLSIKMASAEAAALAVRSAVTQEVCNAVSHINAAAEGLSRQAAHTEASIKSASHQVRFGVVQLVGVMGLSSIFACFFAVLVLYYAPGDFGMRPQLTPDQIRQLDKGHTLDKIWGQLSEKERKYLEELAKNSG